MMYLVNVPDWNSDFKEVSAYDEEDAARRVGEAYFDEDPIDPDTFNVIIIVINQLTNKKSTFEVTAEAKLDFHAKQIKDRYPN
jgi:hypothetical protein